MNKRKVGTDYEQKAMEFLTKQGFRIKDINFRTRQGEIDIIGYDGNVLVFVEVRFRKKLGIVGALESVNLRKQRQICKMSLFYMNRYKIAMNIQIRYDVVAMSESEICWMKNAFEFQGKY